MDREEHYWTLELPLVASYRYMAAWEGREGFVQGAKTWKCLS